MSVAVGMSVVVGAVHVRFLEEERGLETTTTGFPIAGSIFIMFAFVRLVLLLDFFLVSNLLTDLEIANRNDFKIGKSSSESGSARSTSSSSGPLALFHALIITGRERPMKIKATIT